jgi:uncharacterized protein (TIGR00251 family)
LINYYEHDDSLIFSVRVVPRASRSSIMGEHDGTLRVRLAASPVDGAANEELLRTLACAFDIPVREVEITGGHTSKLKKVRIKGAKHERLQSLAEGE